MEEQHPEADQLASSVSASTVQQELAVTPDSFAASTFVGNPVTPLPESFSPQQAAMPKRPAPRRTRLFFMAILVALLVLVSATVSTVLSQPATSTTTGSATAVVLVGSLSFHSSGQLDPTSGHGLNDQISLDLHSLPPPARGHSYYAWLLPDTTDDETKPLLLGTLSVQRGQAHLDYQSPTHNNLLAGLSRFRVTEQPSATTPVLPSLDNKTWRAVGEIPSIPTPGDENHYSLLSHLRHLLAKDPTLQAIGLNGGLDIWLYRNTGKLVEYTTAARDDWPNKEATDLMRREIIRGLDYLDGLTYVPLDVPSGTPFLIDPQAGRMGLLEMTPTQNPPGYLAHVDLHLQGLAQSPGHTTEQQRLALQLDQALQNVTSAMQHIRQDALQLVRMSDLQLLQPQALALINDMVTNANAAYVGHPDPETGENTGGISFVHTQIQGLVKMTLVLPAKGE